MEMLIKPHDSVQKKNNFSTYSPASHTRPCRQFAIWCFNYSYLDATQTYISSVLSPISYPAIHFMNSRIIQHSATVASPDYDRAHQVTYSLDRSTHHARSGRTLMGPGYFEKWGVELHLLCLLVVKWKTLWNFIQCCISSFMSPLSACRYVAHG